MLHTAIETRGKSAEAFRTISEVANDLDVPQHVLRFWEGRFSQIRPVKRAGGRRYYRPDDIDLLRGIRALLYGDGLTIKGVQKILRDRGVRYVAEIGRGEASLLGDRAGGRSSAKKSAKGVSFEVVHGAGADEIKVEDIEVGGIDTDEIDLGRIEASESKAAPKMKDAPVPLPPTPIEAAIAAAPAAELGPETRARLEIRLAELLELKQRLTEAQSRFA
ncbi:MAG TPA: MerR family transcriptional regulator [Rhizomicrobium sp.]|nr:MerR family transcriptional regulator [Rhizomicrobium sp.]